MSVTPPDFRNGHSADVRLQLIAQGRTFPLAQLGPDVLILDAPAEILPGNAEIVMSIDGHESRWAVHLPDGIARNSHTARITAPASVLLQ